MAEKVVAPWTVKQVNSLNGYQRSGAGHPFTGKRTNGGQEVILIATEKGWVEKEGGPVVQDWAHEPMADFSWRKDPWQLLGDEVEDFDD